MVLTKVTGFNPVLTDHIRILWCDVKPGQVGYVTFPGSIAKLGKPRKTSLHLLAGVVRLRVQAVLNNRLTITGTDPRLVNALKLA